MAYPMGESKLEPLRVDFDWRLKLEFHGSDISSDAGRLPYGELDHVLELTETGGQVLSETRRGKNTRHLPVGLLRQSVCGRLAGYEDVNNAERLSHDPVLRAIVDLLMRPGGPPPKYVRRTYASFSYRPESAPQRGHITKIWLSGRCGGKTIPTAMKFG